ncbi:MAG: hypothetical protein U0R67_08140 [Micropruina glycogenica]|jgi:hypothetical protein
MSEQQPPAPGDPQSSGGAPVPLTPLLSDDPPKIGDFWLDARLIATPSGVAYAGHDDANTPVMLLLLSEGAANDPAARDRLAGLVNQLHIDTVIARGGHGQDEGRLGNKYRHESDDPVDPDDAPLAPWVALAYDGSPAAIGEAGRILDEVALARLPLQGTPAGPDYRLHWIDRSGPGVARLWPLPWPGRHDRAGWVSILASWLLMLLLAALAVLIAILIFQQSPQQSPPPPVDSTASPQSGQPSPQSGSPSPQSGSPSPQSGSPSPQSGSPSPQSGSPSPQSGSPSPQSGSPGAGQPTPNSRL